MGNGSLLSKIIHFSDCFVYKAMIQDR